VAAKPTADFDAKFTGATAASADRFVGQSLSGAEFGALIAAPAVPLLR